MPLPTATLTPVSPTPDAPKTVTLSEVTGTCQETLDNPRLPPDEDFCQQKQLLGEAIANSKFTSCQEIQLLEVWQLGGLGAWCGEGDFNGDGLTDLLVTLQREGGDAIGTTNAEVVAYLRQGAGFEIGFSAVSSYYEPPQFPHLTTPYRADLDGDGTSDFTYQVTKCGAHTCTTAVQPVSLQNGELAEEAQESVVPLNAEVAMRLPTVVGMTITPPDGSSGALIKLYGGTIQSVGAGPQRRQTTSFAFVDDAWRQVSVVLDPPEYLYHAIRDADAQFGAGALQAAIGSYAAALADADLKDWHLAVSGDGSGDRDQLVSYALFRKGVAEAFLGLPEARDTLPAAAAEPGLFASAAHVFLETLDAGAPVRDACVQATATLSQRAIDEAFDYGYGNPPPALAEVCNS
jgi:hypothetical protein